MNWLVIVLIRGGRMYYRLVCSTEDIIEHITDNTIIINILDRYEQDDFIICAKEKGQILCWLNRKLEGISAEKKSINGIKLILDEETSALSWDDIIDRYTIGGKKKMEKQLKEIEVDVLQDEEQMYSDDDLYNINSWGADLSFREIISMYEEDELLKPELQRKYVWTKVEASRFIDSILLGLPVPSVFFAKEQDETMLIIDGFQRIMTVFDYVKGIFSGDGKIFKLSNTDNINIRWRGKAFAELEVEEKRRIRNTTIHAIIFEQKYPRNDTGMFQIFERINTGGRTLKAQEIRNCVYQGKCNSLLFKLNTNQNWRTILRMEDEDARMADIELILRFFAMNDLINRKEADNNQINLAKYLNAYMGEKTKCNDDEITMMESKFEIMIKTCKKIFGDNAFRNLKSDMKNFANKINPALFDAVSVATAYAIEKGVYNDNEDYMEKYVKLLNKNEFKELISRRTTNTQNIFKRINMVSEELYGVTYEK